MELLDPMTWYIELDLKVGYRLLAVHPLEWRTQVYTLAWRTLYRYSDTIRESEFLEPTRGTAAQLRRRRFHRRYRRLRIIQVLLCEPPPPNPSSTPL